MDELLFSSSECPIIQFMRYMALILMVAASSIHIMDSKITSLPDLLVRGGLIAATTAASAYSLSESPILSMILSIYGTVTLGLLKYQSVQARKEMVAQQEELDQAYKAQMERRPPEPAPN